MSSRSNLSVFADVPVDRITQRARQARPGRMAVVAIAGIMFGLGWLIAKVFAVAWFAVVWCASCVIEGWIAARAGQAGGQGRAAGTAR